MDQMSLPDTARFWARWIADSVHLQDDSRSRTWSEFDRMSNRWANALGSDGVGFGDRVGILAHNSIEFCEAILGAHKLGATVVPLNIRVPAAELALVIADAEPTVVVADDAHLATLEEALEQVDATVRPFRFPALDSDGFADLPRNDEDPDIRVGGDDLAYIGYTSGTTGRPKGVMVSHRSAWFTGAGFSLACGFTHQDSLYLPMPLAFIGGVSMWASMFVNGGRVVLAPGFDPEATLEVLERERITMFAAVPAMWQQILRSPRFTESDLSSLKYALSGGAPLPASDLLAARAAGVPLAAGYGLTEGGGRSTIMPQDAVETHMGSCGIPTPFTRVRIVGDDGQIVEPGEPGALTIKSPSVMSGYWRNETATAEVLSDGWLTTGDVATMDIDGFITIVGRTKDMLISGGLNVYPAEIELVLADIDDIDEAAVVGMPDERWGEMPVAVIRPKQGRDLDEAAVLKVCRDQLADYKVPRRIIRWHEPLPRGSSGKIIKPRLKELLAEVPGD